MRILFHRFRFSNDVDDVYSQMAIEEWQQGMQGQWVMQHASNVRCFYCRDIADMSYRVDIIGELADGPLITEYALRWKIERYW